MCEHAAFPLSLDDVQRLLLSTHQILWFATFTVAARTRVLLLLEALAWAGHLRNLGGLEGTILVAGNAFDQSRGNVEKRIILIRADVLKFIGGGHRLL